MTEEEQWKLFERSLEERNKASKKGDAIQPSYYKAEDHSLDILDVIAMFNLGFFEGNVLKYIARWKQKNGREDLLKAREYLTRLIDSIK